MSSATTTICRHNNLGIECDVTECDPLAPTISRLTPREISYFNYGKGGERHVFSTHFVYSFPYATAFAKDAPDDVGGPSFGPTRHKTGITVVGFDMFAINSGSPISFVTWSKTGCASGTSLNPVESQVSLFDNTEPYVCAHAHVLCVSVSV
jgi:hypothetical protein